MGLDAKDTELQLQHCERMTHRFYHLLDRHGIEEMIAMMWEGCDWMLKAGRLQTGFDTMREVLNDRPREVVSRHIICNDFATATKPDEIEVRFDLLYFRAPDKAEGHTIPRVYAGLDRYQRREGSWKLIYKELLPITLS